MIIMSSINEKSCSFAYLPSNMKAFQKPVWDIEPRPAECVVFYEYIWREKERRRGKNINLIMSYQWFECLR